MLARTVSQACRFTAADGGGDLDIHISDAKLVPSIYNLNCHYVNRGLPQGMVCPQMVEPILTQTLLFLGCCWRSCALRAACQQHLAQGCGKASPPHIPHYEPQLLANSPSTGNSPTAYLAAGNSLPKFYIGPGKGQGQITYSIAQIRTVPSRLALASRWPSGLQATL